VMAWLGLIAAPALWAASVQLGEILPYLDCRAHVRSSAWVALGAAMLSLMAGGVSWRSTPSGETHLFAARLCALASLVFAFAMLLQAGAGFILTGCER
jgi:hypothetical protein